jgi:cytochrome d ubiquinol oxidase subunit I
MDVLTLSRIQFALNSSFHYIYPPMSIGLGLMILFLEGMYLKTKKPLYLNLTKFWVKIFAATFALGVATGIVQMFGFGTNWSRYSRFVGDVFGSALGAEGIFAFLVEAGFLGVVLFGWDKVSAKMHYFSSIMVAFGAHFSAVWIVIANSWMQTPAGFKVVGQGDEARAIVTNLWEMMFNPSSMDRLAHVIVGCWITGSFMLVSVGAYYYIKKKHLDAAKVCMNLGLASACFFLFLQLLSGHDSGKGVAMNQPAKLAAMEGIFETQESTPISAIGWVDMKTKTTHSLKIPGGLSFLVYNNFKTPVKGLDQFPQDLWPNVPVVFQVYHTMIMCWGAMIGLAGLGLFYSFKKTLHKKTWLLKALVISVVLPHIANFTGWMSAELGRQPWVVYGLLKTKDGVSPVLQPHLVMASIVMFTILYFFLFGLFVYVIDRKIKDGPEGLEESLVYSKNPLEGR